MEQMKAIPYGISDFREIRMGNFYYVDKTSFISEIEKSAVTFLFLRPKRFGKSLLLSMLQCYYDIAEKENFDTLFGGLAIHDNPTPRRNSFLVLRMDFSKLSGSSDTFSEVFTNQCRIFMESFCTRYRDILPEGTAEKVSSISTPGQMLDKLCDIVDNAGYGIYLFIDEYDNYTNSLLSGSSNDVSFYTDLTHKDGLLRSFFTMIKACTNSAIRRMFITGVSPVSMDDLTSGFNIGEDNSRVPAFNSMVGFDENEVRRMLEYYSGYYMFNHSVDELVSIMKPWYDNYCFCEDCLSEPSLFNSDMALYFLKEYTRQCRTPKDMADKNIKTDYAKLDMLVRKDREILSKGLSGRPKGVVSDISYEEKQLIIEEVCTKGNTRGNIVDSFPASGMSRKENFKSLMYYMGLLTVSGYHEGSPILGIPNNVVRGQIFSYMLEVASEKGYKWEDSEMDDRLREMAYRGNYQDVFAYISGILTSTSSQRDMQKGESFIHGFVLATLAKNHYFTVSSEHDMGAAKGYSDIFLEPWFAKNPDMKHSYVIELKYVPLSASESEIESVVSYAESQLKRYLSSCELPIRIGDTHLHGLAVVFRGPELCRLSELSQ